MIYTPYACLRHYESKTRGLELTAEKAERIRKETEIFQDRWKKILSDGDPHYNQNLTFEKPDFSLSVLKCNIKEQKNESHAEFQMYEKGI